MNQLLSITKLSALRDFLEVVERGSLRAAARHLGTAQPTISRNIRELERKLDLELFERSATGTQLTELGKVFYGRVKGVQAELQRAHEELEQLRGNGQGSVRVALSSVAQITLLPGAMSAFRKRYPKVKLEIIDGMFARIESELRNGVIDCYVGPVPQQISSDFRVEKLFDSSHVIVGRKDHPLARARSLSDLAEAEWASIVISGSVGSDLAALFAHHGLPVPQPAVKVHSALSMMLVVFQSDLLMLVPLSWVQSPLWTDTLMTIPIDEIAPAPAICMVRRSALPLTPAAEHFCDMMRRGASHLASPTGKLVPRRSPKKS